MLVGCGSYAPGEEFKMTVRASMVSSESITVVLERIGENEPDSQLTRRCEEKHVYAKEGMSIGVCGARTVLRIARSWQKRIRGPYALNWHRRAVGRPAGFRHASICISLPREAVAFMLK